MYCTLTCNAHLPRQVSQSYWVLLSCSTELNLPISEFEHEIHAKPAQTCIQESIDGLLDRTLPEDMKEEKLLSPGGPCRPCLYVHWIYAFPADWPWPQQQLRSQHAHEAHSTEHADVTPQGPERYGTRLELGSPSYSTARHEHAWLHEYDKSGAQIRLVFKTATERPNSFVLYCITQDSKKSPFIHCHSCS